MIRNKVLLSQQLILFATIVVGNVLCTVPLIACAFLENVMNDSALKANDMEDWGILMALLASVVASLPMFLELIFDFIIMVDWKGKQQWIIRFILIMTMSVPCLIMFIYFQIENTPTITRTIMWTIFGSIRFILSIGTIFYYFSSCVKNRAFTIHHCRNLLFLFIAARFFAVLQLIYPQQHSFTVLYLILYCIGLVYLFSAIYMWLTEQMNKTTVWFSRSSYQSSKFYLLGLVFEVVSFLVISYFSSNNFDHNRVTNEVTNSTTIITRIYAHIFFTILVTTVPSIYNRIENISSMAENTNKKSFIKVSYDVKGHLKSIQSNVKKLEAVMMNSPRLGGSTVNSTVIGSSGGGQLHSISPRLLSIPANHNYSFTNSGVDSIVLHSQQMSSTSATTNELRKRRHIMEIKEFTNKAILLLDGMMDIDKKDSDNPLYLSLVTVRVVPYLVQTLKPILPQYSYNSNTFLYDIGCNDLLDSVAIKFRNLYFKIDEYKLTKVIATMVCNVVLLAIPMTNITIKLDIIESKGHSDSGENPYSEIVSRNLGPGHSASGKMPHLSTIHENQQESGIHKHDNQKLRFCLLFSNYRTGSQASNEVVGKQQENQFAEFIHATNNCIQYNSNARNRYGMAGSSLIDYSQQNSSEDVLNNLFQSKELIEMHGGVMGYNTGIKAVKPPENAPNTHGLWYHTQNIIGTIQQNVSQLTSPVHKKASPKNINRRKSTGNANLSTINTPGVATSLQSLASTPSGRNKQHQLAPLDRPPPSTAGGGGINFMRLEDVDDDDTQAAQAPHNEKQHVSASSKSGGVTQGRVISKHLPENHPGAHLTVNLGGRKETLYEQYKHERDHNQASQHTDIFSAHQSDEEEDSSTDDDQLSQLYFELPYERENNDEYSHFLTQSLMDSIEDYLAPPIRINTPSTTPRNSKIISPKQDSHTKSAQNIRDMLFPASSAAARERSNSHTHSSPPSGLVSNNSYNNGPNNSPPASSKPGMSPSVSNHSISNCIPQNVVIRNTITDRRQSGSGNSDSSLVPLSVPSERTLQLCQEGAINSRSDDINDFSSSSYLSQQRHTSSVGLALQIEHRDSEGSMTLQDIQSAVTSPHSAIIHGQSSEKSAAQNRSLLSTSLQNSNTMITASSSVKSPRERANSNAISLTRKFSNISNSQQGGNLQKRALIVDDSKTNRKVLAKLLGREGFICDGVSDGDVAVAVINSLLHNSLMPSNMYISYNISNTNVGLLNRVFQQAGSSNSAVTNQGKLQSDNAVDLNPTTTATQNNSGIENSNYYTVIAMDYTMTNMNGPQATQLIREAGFQHAIIGITGLVLASEIKHFLHSGADAVLTKPVNIELFMRTYREIMSNERVSLQYNFNSSPLINNTSNQNMTGSSNSNAPSLTSTLLQPIINTTNALLKRPGSGTSRDGSVGSGTVRTTTGNQRISFTTQQQQQLGSRTSSKNSMLFVSDTDYLSAESSPERDSLAGESLMWRHSMGSSPGGKSQRGSFTQQTAPLNSISSKGSSPTQGFADEAINYRHSTGQTGMLSPVKGTGTSSQLPPSSPLLSPSSGSMRGGNNMWMSRRESGSPSTLVPITTTAIGATDGIASMRHNDSISSTTDSQQNQQQKQRG